jgi:hypothetical protein
MIDGAFLYLWSGGYYVITLGALLELRVSWLKEIAGFQ